jgi:phosphodiesterase/alkaline phosphatase D-like protein
LGTEAGSRKVRLRVVVSAVPFTLNAGEMSSSRRRQLALLNATIADMESDGWRQFPAERQQILRWMHEAQMPVLLLSGDMHWAGVFNAGGVVEVSASPIAQVAALAECVRVCT